MAHVPAAAAASASGKATIKKSLPTVPGIVGRTLTGGLPGFASASTLLPTTSSIEGSAAPIKKKTDTMGMVMTPAVRVLQPLNVECLPDTLACVIKQDSASKTTDTSSTARIQLLSNTPSQDSFHVAIPYVRFTRYGNRVMQSKTFASKDGRSRTVYSLAFMVKSSSPLFMGLMKLQQHIDLALEQADLSAKYSTRSALREGKLDDGTTVYNGRLQVSLSSSLQSGDFLYQFGFMNPDGTRVGEEKLFPDDYKAYTHPLDFERYSTSRASVVVRVDLNKIPNILDADGRQVLSQTMTVVALYRREEPAAVVYTHPSTSIILPWSTSDTAKTEATDHAAGATTLLGAGSKRPRRISPTAVDTVDPIACAAVPSMTSFDGYMFEDDGSKVGDEAGPQDDDAIDAEAIAARLAMDTLRSISRRK